MDIKFKDNSKLKLQLSPFTQLEYIESTGTQYIDTGIKLNSSNIEILCGLSKTAQTNLCIGNYGNNLDDRFEILLENSNGVVLGRPNNIQFTDNVILESKITVKFKYNNGTSTVICNGVTTTKTGQNSLNTNNNSIWIFRRNLNCYAEPGTYFKGRIYELSIKKDNIITLNLIPAKDTNNVVCLYDTISESFFYNQGTGDFVAGPVVKPGKPGLPTTILLKTTTLYHKNTPNVNGRQLLYSILSTQKTAEDVVLNRIRVDIGNVSGSLSELMQYAGMAGFNDNYEPQTKPRLVGTWTINDWYTTAQLAQAQAAFDGLTIVGDPNYVIDFSQLAVQVLDPNEDNYNPAVAIILQGQNRGTTMTNAPLGHGRWFMSKSQAATITSIGTWFRSKISVVDTNGIVSSDTTRSYNFEGFDEFEYFTGFSTIPEYAFNGCTKLTTITLSNNVKRLESLFSDHQGVFQNCTSLVSINLDEGLEYIGNRTFAGCTNLNVTEIPSSVTYIGDQAFKLCTSLVSLDVKANIDTIRSGCFGGCSSLRYIKFYNDIKTINNANSGSTNGAFTSCSNLETIIFGESLETIGTSGDGNGSFANCNKLIITKLPNSIKNIGAYAFYKCTSIPYLHIEATTPPTLTPDTWGRTPNYFDGATFKIYVGDGSSAADDNAILADYLAATNWATYSSRLDTWYNYLHP